MILCIILLARVCILCIVLELSKAYNRNFYLLVIIIIIYVLLLIYYKTLVI